MRIVFLGNFQVDYTSESHHAKSLESLGHTVTRLQEGKVSSSHILKHAKQSDLFIWVHTHGWRTPGYPMRVVLNELKRAKIPSLTYHLDLWFGLQRQKDMQTDDVWHIEHFFTVDKLMADWLNEQKAQGKGTTTGHYIPAGVFGEECHIAAWYHLAKYDPNEPKIITRKFEHELIFVGAKNYHQEWSYRPKLINWLQETYGEKFELWGGDGKGVVRGAALNELYAKTKVVVGDTLCIDYKYPYYYSDRIFETIGRGGFIIHPYIKGLEEIFEDKRHCVFYEYGNFDQLKGLIDYYLTHDEEREAIRLAGHEYVKNNHTYVHRWKKILEMI